MLRILENLLGSLWGFQQPSERSNAGDQPDDDRVEVVTDETRTPEEDTGSDSPQAGEAGDPVTEPQESGNDEPLEGDNNEPQNSDTEELPKSSGEKPQEDSAPNGADEFEFEESFEMAQVTDLLGDWTGGQLVRGEISVTKDIANTGDTSLYMLADNNIGKSHIFKAGYWVDEGDSAQAVAHFYIPSGTSLKNLYIMDWESKSVWSDENILPNTQPGIRIGFFGKDGGIAVERGKMSIGTQSDFVNQDFVMPRDQWVKIDWQIKAGLGDEGAVRLLVNDEVVIDARGTTYIDERVAEANGILVNEDYAFDRFKVGITANSTLQDVEMMVDDVSIQTWDSSSSDAEWLLT